MNDRRVKGLGATAAIVVAFVACQHHAAPVVRTAAAPALPPEVASPTTSAPPSGLAAAAVAREDTSTEQHVTIDTHGADLDVRQVLDFLASQGHLNLVYSSGIKKTVRLQLVNVPVSVALQTVLSMSNLTLESTTEPPKAPGSTSVVFYQLPVNVDSLSVDAIMKRFGVGRGVAELIVKTRVEKP